MNEILVRLRDQFAAEVAGMDAAQTQLRPVGRPEAWTIQQIAEHLMLSYVSTVNIMNVRLQKGTPTKAKASLSNRILQFVLTTAGYFPKGRIAPEMVRPGVSQTTMDGRQISDVFAASVNGMDLRLNEVERVLGRGRCVSHLALGPMSIAQWRKFHLTHGRHHFRQISRIRETQSAR